MILLLNIDIESIILWNWNIYGFNIGLELFPSYCIVKIIELMYFSGTRAHTSGPINRFEINLSFGGKLDKNLDYLPIMLNFRWIDDNLEFKDLDTKRIKKSIKKRRKELKAFKDTR